MTGSGTRSITGAGAGTSATGAGASAGGGSATAVADDADTAGWRVAAGGAGGLKVLMSRGGGSAGAAGFAGSTAAPFFAAVPAAFLTERTAASEKMSPFGSSMPRWRARRSTN